MSEMENYEATRFDRQDMLIVFALAVAGLLVFSFLFSTRYEGLRSNDQFDYAQIARNVYRGNGFTTLALKPAELAFDPRLEHHPDYWRPPLYPLLIAAVFLFLGPKEYAGVLVSGIFFALLLPLAYVFGRKLANRTTGISAAVILLCLPEMWDYSLHGLTEMTFAFLFTLLVYGLHSGLNPMLLGIVFGLCYLTRYNAFIYLPLLAWYLLIVERWKWRESALFGAGCILVTAPWLVRNLALTGNPFFSLQKIEIAKYTNAFPGYSAYLVFETVGPVFMLTRHAGEVFEKYLRGLNILVAEIPSLIHPALMALFFGGLLAFRLPRRVRFLLYTIILILALQTHVLALTHPLIRLFTPLVPAIVLFATVCYSQLLHLLPWPNGRAILWYAGIVAMACLLLNRGLRASYETVEAAPLEVAEHIKAVAGAGPVATDHPWELSWRADIITIWAPVSYAELEASIPNVQYVYFSGMPSDMTEIELYSKGYIFNQSFKNAFEPVKQFGGRGVLFKRKNGTTSEPGLEEGKTKGPTTLWSKGSARPK